MQVSGSTPRTSIRRLAVLAVAAATLLVVISSVWNVNNLNIQVKYLAAEEARTNWNKDQAFRRWATGHGGLYVKPDKRTPPNPYLAHMPKRDVETADGVKLTLMNPAYMMSQMTREFESMYGIKGKITGQKLLNPANEPDPWELSALKQFDRGVMEVVEEADIAGEPYIRLMRPMFMTEGCVLCHGHLGFKTGDIRGGVSVSIPLEPYLTAAASTRVTILLTHGFVWLTCIFAIGFFYWRALLRESEIRNAETSLQVALSEAESASAAKSEFLASMSHELRTPLNAILGFAQILRSDTRRPLSETQNKHIDYILDGGSHLLDLVNEVLDLARIEADQLDLSIEDVGAAEIVAECIALTIPLGEQHGITITDKIGSGPLHYLRADRLRLKQVLINILSNAVKYNSDGGTVSIEARETGDDFLRITVTDTGVGIAEKEHTAVFQPFQRLDVASGLAKEGTGIGLNVTKLLVEKMGGRIDFESVEGIGSSFWIELPMTSNQDIIVWEEILRVGIDPVDKDHQVIVSLTNKIFNRDVRDGELEAAIGELLENYRHHFLREEAIMELLEFPELESHRREHLSLLDRLDELVTDWRSEHDPDALRRLRELLREGWESHIVRADAKLAGYGKGRSMEIRNALEALELGTGSGSESTSEPSRSTG